MACLFMVSFNWYRQPKRLGGLPDSTPLFFFFFFSSLYLLAISRHACSSRSSLGVSGFHGLRVCLMEDSLEHLLLFHIQNLCQILIKLRLLLLETCRRG